MLKVILDGQYTLYTSSDISENVGLIVEKFSCALKKAGRVDIACPVFLDSKGLIFYHGGGFTKNEKLPYPEAQEEEDVNQFPDPRTVEFSPLWCFVFRSDIKSKLPFFKNFDRDIYKHADFCVQLLKAGLKITILPDVKIKFKKAFLMTDEKIGWIKKLTKSKEEFLKKHGKFLDSKYRLPVVFHSHTGFPGGYCLHARSLVKELARKKIDVHYKFIGGCNDDEPLSEHFLVDDLRLDMGSMRMPQVTLSTGLNCFSNSGDYKIGFTTTEVDGIPKDWVSVLNEQNEVWTTSEFSKKYIKRSGVKPKVFNMSEGVDPDYFHPGIRPFENKTGKKFLFICNFAWGRRKGIAEIFEAFTKEFSNKEDVALILKVLPSYHRADIQADIKNLYYEPNRAPISVWETILPNYLVGGFYTMGQCFIFPTRGEGFGLPPLEALACGVPVITTGYSGHMDYLLRGGRPLPGVEFIKYKIKKFDGSDSIYYHGFNWALPDVSHLRRLMRKVYENYAHYKSGAMESSKYIRKNWSWSTRADLVISRLERIFKEKGIKCRPKFKVF